MAEEEKKATPEKSISDSQRFRYIGFEVFPGKPKNLFSSEAEKAKLVKAVEAKRSKGDVIRDECTLLESRVSSSDRIIAIIASLAIVFSLFLPWYSAYNEVVVEENAQPTQEVVADSSVVSDSSVLAITGQDSLAVTGEATGEVSADTPDLSIAETTSETSGSEEEEGTDTRYTETTTEELIHGYVAKKKINKEYDRLTGIGSLLSLGSVGSYVFSSGMILILTGLIFLVWTLLSIALPAYTLFGLFGLKGNPDEKALKLKKILKLNWLPTIFFVASLMLSFVGATYGFDPTVLYQSIGGSYGPGAFLGTLSWGVFIALGASILLAVKGVEI